MSEDNMQTIPSSWQALCRVHEVELQKDLVFAMHLQADNKPYMVMACRATAYHALISICGVLVQVP